MLTQTQTNQTTTTGQELAENSINYLDLLWDFAHKRPGFDLADYGGGREGFRYYRQDYRRALADLHAFRELYSCLIARAGHRVAAELVAAELRRTSGRLTISEYNPEKLQYITGQYFPTEFRGAACRILVSCLWNHYRDERRADGSEVYKDGPAIRKAIKNRLRSRNSRSWFN